MIVSLAKSLASSFFYSLNGTILQKVPTDPYLGIKLSDNPKWTRHFNAITKKANCILGFHSSEPQALSHSLQTKCLLGTPPPAHGVRSHHLGPLLQARHRQAGASSAKRSALHSQGL